VSLRDAAQLAQLISSRRGIAEGSGSLLDKAEDLSVLDRVEQAPDTEDTKRTLGNLLKGVIGSAFGFGLAKGISSEMGLPDGAADNVAEAGALLGGLVGLSKIGQDERLAFRAAFVKEAIEQGYFKKALFNWVTDIPMAAANIAHKGSETAGAALGTIANPGDADEDITKTKVETELLRQELERLKAQQQNSALKQILAKRRSASNV